MTRPLLRLCLVPLALAIVTDAAAYDVVLTRKKERLEGTVLEQNDKEIRFYPYFSRLPGIEWEVVTLPRNEVVKIETVEDKIQVFWGKLAQLSAEDVKARLELARQAAADKLDIEKLAAIAGVLAAEPENAEALALLSDKEKKDLFQENPRVDRALAERIKAYAAIVPKADRKAEYEALKKDLGVTLPHLYYERIARSALQPKGLREDVKLTLLSEKHTGVYTVFVPEEYDPARPWPLVVGLHGGGPDGADGKGVVGSGREFMPFIRDLCAQRGYLAVCPSARAAPWSSPENDDFFRDVIREIELLYHVDLNRVYLIGHSMGGYGTWHFGPKYSDLFAAIAPASGGNHNGQKKLAQTHTAVYCYHSNDDPRCRVDDSREAAKIMKKTQGLDFVYTELPNRQHEFPHEVVVDMFDLFDRRRMWVPVGAKNARPGREPRSSFLEKQTVEEAAAFPFPDEQGGEGGKPEIRKLMETLIKGGGNAEKAAQRLAELKDASAVPMLGRALTQAGLANDDARAQAAWALGEIGNSAGVRFLVAALKDKAQPVRTRAIEGLGKLADPKSLAPAVAALKDLAARFASKTQGKSTMDLTDWDALMADLAVYARALARFKDAKSAADLRAQGVAAMLLAKVDVRYDREVESGPAGSKRAAAEALIEAFAAIGGSESAAALADLAQGMAGEAGDVAERARDEAKKLNG